METKPTTIETVLAHAGTMEAVARLVAYCDQYTFLFAHTDEYDDLSNEVACWALTVYHEQGRADVDEVGEGLGVTIRDMIDDALRAGKRGEALRADVVSAVVETATMQFGSAV